MSLDQFAKTLHAYLYGAVDAFGGTSYLFDTSPKGGYSRVFGDGDTPFDHLTKDRFERMSGIWFLCESVAEELQAHKERLLAEAEGNERRLEYGFIRVKCDRQGRGLALESASD